MQDIREEVTQELVYIRNLLKIGGNSDVPAEALASYLRTQAGRFQRAGAPTGPRELGRVASLLRMAAGKLERLSSIDAETRKAQARIAAGLCVRQALRASLEAEGAAAAAWRGHRMRPYRSSAPASAAPSEAAKRSQAECCACGRGVWIDTDPPVNGIELAGEALALECTEAPATGSSRSARAAAEARAELMAEGCADARPEDCGGSLEPCSDGRARCDAHADAFESHTQKGA